MRCGKYENDPNFGNDNKYAGGDPLEMRNSYTGLTIVNATGKNVADWILKTVDKNTFNYRRYGGFSIGGSVGINQTRLEILETLFGENFGENLEKFMRTKNAKVWYNNFGVHSSATYSNAMANAILRHSASDLPPSELGIDVIS